jgi:hypothetical protein
LIADIEGCPGSVTGREVRMSSSVERTAARVVAHYKGGRLLKGYTRDFVPGRNTFTLVSEQKRDLGQIYKVKIDDLKAVFFVKELQGNIFYREKKRFKEVDMSHLRGIGVRLHFKDGEVIRGSSLDYAIGKKAFFVTPVDPDSNNERIYVVADALADIKVAGEAFTDSHDHVGVGTNRTPTPGSPASY